MESKNMEQQLINNYYESICYLFNNMDKNEINKRLPILLDSFSLKRHEILSK